MAHQASSCSITPSSNQQSASRAQKAIWTLQDDTNLVKCLTKQQALGNQADNNWKAAVWTAAAEWLMGSELRSRGSVKSLNSRRDHWGTVSVFSLLSSIIDG